MPMEVLDTRKKIKVRRLGPLRAVRYSYLTIRQGQIQRVRGLGVIRTRDVERYVEDIRGRS